MLAGIKNRRRLSCQFIAILLVLFMTLQVAIPSGISSSEAYFVSQTNSDEIRSAFADLLRSGGQAQSNQTKKVFSASSPEGANQAPKIATPIKEEVYGTPVPQIDSVTFEEEEIKVVASGEGVPARAGEFIVHFKEALSETIESRVLQASKAKPADKKIKGLNARLVVAEPGSDPQTVIAKLKKDPRVKHVEPNYLFEAQGAPAEPLYTQQWGMAEIQAEYAWEEVDYLTPSATVTEIKVAVIDTGVDTGHEDLTGKVLTGYNSITGATENNTADDSREGHGTHVAGVIAAVYDNGKGTAGVAGGFPVKILPVKTLDSAGVGTMLDLAKGIRWAVDNGAKVINLSLGARLPDYPLTLAEAVKDAQDRGVLVIAAAGNESSSVDGFYPACLPGVISVGASGKDHHPASFSNRNAYIMAPGVDIISTVPGNDYDTLSGTSMAAPFVSGAAALFWIAHPQKSSVEVAEALKRGYRDFSEGCRYYWWGKVCDYRYYVFSAYQGILKLSGDLNLWPWLEFVQPTWDQSDHVSGEVDLAVQIDVPIDVARVDFSLQPEDYSDSPTILGSVYGPSDSGLFNFKWDSTTVADGPYTIYAEAFDAAGESLADNDIYLVVSNTFKNGLVLTVKKPDGTPAAGAAVNVFHPVKEDYSWGESVEYEYLWNGNADLQGRVIISGTEATGGNDFLVTAQGTEPNFLYYKIVRAPAQVTLDATNAQRVTISGRKTDGQPLAGALVTGDLLESSLPIGQGSKDAVPYNSDVTLSILNASGEGEITLTKGKYNVRLLSEEEAYFLIKNEVDINASTTTMNFTPQANEVATVKVSPEAKYSETGILLSDRGDYYYGFKRVNSDREITVYPGSYSAVIDTVYQDPYYRDYTGKGLEWLRRLQTPDFELAPGESREILFGDISEASLSLPEGYPGYFTSHAYFPASFVDSYENMTTYIAKQPYTPVVSSSQTEAGDEGDIVKLAAGRADNPEQGEAPKVEPAKTFIYSSSTRQFEPITQAATVINPALDIRDSQDGIPPGSKGIYYADYDGCWRAYWFVPSDQAPGDYKAQVTWEAGPFAISQEEEYLVTPAINFSVQDEPGDIGTAPISVEITDLAGNPMTNASLWLLRENEDSYDAIESSEVDSEGRAEIWRNLREGESYVLAVFGSAGAQWPGEKAIFFYPMVSGNDYQNLNINLADYNLKQLQLQAKDRDDALLDAEECTYSVTHFNANQIPYSIHLGNTENSYFGLWVPDGRYLFQANITSKWGYPRPALYHIVKEVNVPQDLSDVGYVGMGGENLAELSVIGPVPNGEDRDPYQVGGVALFKKGLSQAPVLYPIDQEQKIMVTPGSYEAIAVLSREHYDDNWVYWLTKDIDVAAGSDVTWAVYGDPFTASIELDAPSYGLGANVTSENKIQDAGGNRLIGIATDMYVGGPSSVGESDGPVSGQNHQEIAPFFVIKDPGGTEIHRHKELTYSLEELESWVEDSWGESAEVGPQYYGSVNMVNAPTGQGTYYEGKYTFTSDPEQAEGGNYTALVELGAGPEGTVSGSQSFVLEAAPGVTLDDKLGTTNATEITVSGKTMANAVVTIQYRINDGEKVMAGNATANSEGEFTVEVSLPEEGDYVFTAFASRDGIAGRESSPVNLIVDRTPPDAPAELTAQGQDQSHILLTWKASGNTEVEGYRIYRDGVMLEQVAEGLALRYLDGNKGDLQQGVSYKYEVRAFDEAGNLSVPAETTGQTSGHGDQTAPTAPRNLRVTLGQGGTADLEWQAATDNIGIKGYKIWRGESGSPSQVIESVYGNILTFKDSGLTAETSYVYYVTAYDDSGNESAASNQVSMVTPKVRINSFNWKVPRLYRNGPAEYGSSLELSLLGDPNRRAVAEIVYLSWLDDVGTIMSEPREVTLELELKEVTPGAYRNVFTLTPGTVESINSLRILLADNKGHLDSREIDTNLKVAGLLKVNVGTGYPEVPADVISGARLSAWSVNNGSGTAETIEELGLYQLSLAQGEDYLLRIFTPEGKELLRKTGVVVKSGREQQLELNTQLPASLDVHVVEAGTDGTEEPVSGVLVHLAGKDGSGYSGITDERGIVRRSGHSGAPVVPQDLSGTELQASAFYNDEQRLLYQRSDSVKSVLKPGANESKIVLSRRSLGEIRGRVTDMEENPLQGANVVVSHQVEPSFVANYSVVTDEEGRYSLALPAGRSRVVVSHQRHASTNLSATVISGEAVELDASLKPTGLVSLTVYATTMGQSENLVPMIMNRSELTITNKRTGFSWRPSARSTIITLFDCEPGDIYELNMDGTSAGFTSQTQVVTLDEDRTAQTEFHLVQLGQIKARVRSALGNPPTPYLRADLYLPNGRQVSGALRLSRDEVVISGVPDGTYTMEFYEGRPYQSWWGIGSQKPSPELIARVEEVTVKACEISDIGDVTLPQQSYNYSGRFAGPGNGFTTGALNAAPGSIISLRAAYSHKGSEWSSSVNNVKLYLDVPQGTTLVENSIVTRVVYGSPDPRVTVSGNQIVVDLAQTTLQQDLEGVVTYQVKLNSEPDWPQISGRALIGYESLSYGASTGLPQYVSEVLGQVSVDVPYVSISGPKKTGEEVITVSGRAPEGKLVKIYDGEIYLGETQANRFGVWKTKVTLPDRGIPSEHYLYVSTEGPDGEAIVSPWYKIIVGTKEPVLTSVRMYQPGRGGGYTFYPGLGFATPYFSWNPTMALAFEMQFTDNEAVRDVKVWTGNHPFGLRADFDGEKYVASGYPGSYGQVPGDIYVTFKKRISPSVFEQQQLTEQELRRRLPLWAKEFQLVAPAPAGSVGSSSTVAPVQRASIDFTLPELDNTPTNVEITINHGANYTPSQAEIDQYQETGIPVFGFTFGLIKKSNETEITMRGYMPAEMVTEVSPSVVVTVPAKLVEVATKVKVAMPYASLAGKLKNGWGNMDKYEKLNTLLDALGNCSAADASSYQDQLDSMNNQILASEVVKASLGVAAVVAGAASVGIGAGVVGVIGLAYGFGADYQINSRLDDIKAGIEEDCKDEEDEDDDDDDDDDDNDDDDSDDDVNPDDDDKIGSPRWGIDPSGFVYEAVYDNRVSGVTATALEYLADEGRWSFWDASQCLQENPLITDNEGKYAWDVTQGLWKVSYSKEGYEPTESWEMKVPPPHLDVNVGLVSLTAPTVTDISAVPGGASIDITFDKYMLVKSVSDITVDVTLVEEGDGAVEQVAEEAVEDTVEDAEEDPQMIAGDVAPIDVQEDPNNNSIRLARKFRFTPTQTLTVGGTYAVTVDEMAQSYAGRPMAADYTGNVTVTEAVTPSQPPSSRSSSGVSDHELKIAVGSAAKKITAFNGELTLEIPAGTFISSNSLVIRKLAGQAKPDTKGMTVVSTLYEIDTGGVKPKKPMLVAIKYNNNLLKDIDPRKLGIYGKADSNQAQWSYMGGLLNGFTVESWITADKLGQYTLMAYEVNFADLSDHWSRNDAEVLAARHLVNGTGAGNYTPERVITRAEMATMLVKMVSLDSQKEEGTSEDNNSFSDVPEKAWYHDYVEKAAHYGFIKGNNGRFRPNDPVTREEMAVMLVNASGFGCVKANLSTFSDEASISAWAREAVAVATEKGLMKGFPGNIFQGKDSATRAQAAMVMLRAMEAQGLITKVELAEPSG